MKIKNNHLLKDLLIEALSHTVHIEINTMIQSESDTELPDGLSEIEEFREALIKNTSINTPERSIKTQITFALREVLIRQGFEVNKHISKELIQEEQIKVDALIEACKKFISPTLLKIRLAINQMIQDSKI